MLAKALHYLSSLVTIATPTRSTRSSRYISLVTPTANPSFCCLSFQFSAANDWNELHTKKSIISPSLTLSVSCQSSLTIAAAVHSPSTNSPSNQLPTSSPYLFFCSFAHQYFYLHISLQCKLLNCNYFTSMAYLLPYLLTSFAHRVHRFFYCVIDCTFVYSMCNCVVFVPLLCFILARSQL